MNESAFSISLGRIEKQLQTQWMGQALILYEEIDSTNEEFFRLLAENPQEPRGKTLIAKKQTQGRGRQGSTWYSATEEGLYLSCLLRPKIPLSDLSWITLVLALGVAQTIEQFQIYPQIKWPNDLQIKGQKIAGILVESRNLQPSQLVLVAGLGINLNQSQFPNTLGQPATSLRKVSGQLLDPNLFLIYLFRLLEENMTRLENGDKKTLLKEITQRSATLSKEVLLFYRGKEYAGRVEGFSERLGLLLRKEDGSLEEFPAEITTLREKVT